MGYTLEPGQYKLPLETFLPTRPHFLKALQPLESCHRLEAEFRT